MSINGGGRLHLYPSLLTSALEFPYRAYTPRQTPQLKKKYKEVDRARRAPHGWPQAGVL